MSTKKDDIIKSLFDCSCYVVRDGNTNKINDISVQFKEKYRKAYLNKAAFLYLSIGYLISLFGMVEVKKQSCAVLLVFFLTLLIIGITIALIELYLLKQLKVTNGITNADLKRLNLTPHMESLPDKEIEEICNNTFAGNQSVNHSKKIF